MGKFIFILLFSIGANAQDVNLLKNPNFESRLSRWSGTGASTLAVESASPLEGSYSANWDASATGEFLRSNSYAIQDGMKGRRCTIEMDYLWDAGVSGEILMNVDDGTDNVASISLSPTTGGISAKASQTFECPSSGSLRFELESTADAASIRVDKMYLGSGKTSFAKPQDVFSAKVDSADTVSQENIDWINGNCTNATTGRATCVFNTGIFTTPPNCSAVPITTSATVARDVYVNATATVAEVYSSTGGVAINVAFYLTCQKVESSANRETVTLETSGASWAGYHAQNCSWARTNVAYGDPTADATCDLVERTNSGFGSVTSSGSTLPNIVFTPPRSGAYWVCAHIIAFLGGGTNVADFRLWDGTTVIAESQMQQPSSGQNLTVPLCGVYNNAGLSPKTLSIQSKVTASSVTIVAAGTNTSSIEWSIFPISQSFPAPVFTELQNLVKSGENGVKVVAARITSVTTTSVLNEYGNWIDSVADNGAGNTTVNISAGIFTNPPACSCAVETAATTQFCLIDSATPTTNTVVRFQASNTSFTGVDHIISVQCIGN